jgi:hypothetical protein
MADIIANAGRTYIIHIIPLESEPLGIDKDNIHQNIIGTRHPTKTALPNGFLFKYEIIFCF